MDFLVNAAGPAQKKWAFFFFFLAMRPCHLHFCSFFPFPCPVGFFFFPSCAEVLDRFRGLWRPCPKVFHLSLDSIFLILLLIVRTYVTEIRCAYVFVEPFAVVHSACVSCATFQVDREKKSARLFHSYFSFPFLEFQVKPA